MLAKKALRNTVAAFTLAGLMCIGSTPLYAELGDQVLQKGMSHKDIETLQQNLTDLGYFEYDGITNYYGVHTENAVSKFQKSVELEPNGIFDKETYNALIDRINSTEENTYDESLSLEEEIIEDENIVEIEAASDEDADKYKLILDRSLKFGNSGLDVNALQEALKALGYLKIDNTTNYFGSQTEEAIKIFQENMGLVVDGSVGPQTVDMINRQLVRRGLKVAMPNRGSVNRERSGEEIVSTAKKYIGVRYRSGGTSTNGFDCTGYTQFVYKQFGISLPRTTSSQATAGTGINKSDLQVGDLIIFKNTYRKGPSHAGIYVGDGQFIHASTSRGVRIDHLNSSYWGGRFHSARRVF